MIDIKDKLRFLAKHHPNKDLSPDYGVNWLLEGADRIEVLETTLTELHYFVDNCVLTRKEFMQHIKKALGEDAIDKTPEV